MFRNTLSLAFLTLFLLHFLDSDALSHGVGPRGAQVLGWHTQDISRAVSFTPYDDPGAVVKIERDRCLKGYQFYFDVRDTFAFDVDEDIDIEILFYLTGTTNSVSLKYDANGGESSTETIALPPGSRKQLHKATVKLHRARFAGRLDFGTDFKVAASAVN